jgi:hypothetical protein
MSAVLEEVTQFTAVTTAPNPPTMAAWICGGCGLGHKANETKCSKCKTGRYYHNRRLEAEAPAKAA